jgi:DNA-binding NarL/FixJ family response regulator
MSHTLYDFLASELLASALPETQTALMLLAVATAPDVEVARILLDTRTDHVLEDAVARGLVAVTERKSLLIHPLLRELLIRRFGEADDETREALLSDSRRLFPAHRWDEALAVAEAARDPAFVTEAIAAALDDLLAAGRTSSLERWVAAARSAGAEGGLIDYAESEALYRDAKFDRAIALATQSSVSLEGDLAARAHLVAARAANLTDRSGSAQAHAETAASVAETAETNEEALWLRFLSGIESQATDLDVRLADFRRSARPGIKQALISATGGLALASMEGGLDRAIDEARVALTLAGEGADAIAHTGLLSSYSYSLILTCRYETSLQTLGTVTRLAEASGIDFPMPYAQLYSASAHIGLRRFVAADRALRALERDTRDESGTYFQGNLPIQRARLYASVGDLARALEVLSLGPVAKGGRGLHGEFLGWQALLHSASGQFEIALELAHKAREASRGLEALALAFTSRAVVALRTAEPETAGPYLKEAIATGVWDPILIAVRSATDLGRYMTKDRASADWLRRILVLSSDSAVADLIGLRVPRNVKRKQGLTPRESEVHELVAQGLTNEQIAKLLCISLSTTKVHVKHIYNKLGVRSRLEAARALREDV